MFFKNEDHRIKFSLKKNKRHKKFFDSEGLNEIVNKIKLINNEGLKEIWDIVVKFNI